jgi:cytoskeletal protein CcmA (bactofilin family)
MKDLKKPEMDDNRITGFFDDGTEFSGDLRFTGSFRIDGYYKGRIESESVLIIGERGKVEADIIVRHVLINGEVKGSIKAAEKVEIHHRGRVSGSIRTPKLVIEEGAYLDANCQTAESTSAPSDPAKVQEG